MPPTSRPFKNHSIIAMWQVLEENPDDAALAALERELRDHRSTDAAKELLKEVVSARAAKPRSSGASAAPSRPPSARPTQGTSRSVARIRPRSDGGRTQQSQIGGTTDILRDLIGVEAERLARWGLAPGMPSDIEETVFAAWEARLTSREDVHGRCIERLRQDRAWLADHRRGRS